jgi:hypothetical protein
MAAIFFDNGSHIIGNIPTISGGEDFIEKVFKKMLVALLYYF